tara:strand:+ start:2166 stop:2621 length:456 start_codon:yes stop_codon:yes gene_type:complete
MLSFKDMMTVMYRPGEDELVNYRAYRRKRLCEETDSISVNEEDVDEALTLQQRQKKARIIRRLKSRIKIGRARAKKRMANVKVLKRRTNKKARDMVVRKLTKDIPKKDLTFARRQEIEKRLERPAFKARIQRLAKRLFPKIRKAEMQRKKG